MMMRGVKKMGSKTITSKMLGCYDDDKEKKQEFFTLLQISPKKN
jgi:GTP cyclohydrolase I